MNLHCTPSLGACDSSALEKTELGLDEEGTIDGSVGDFKAAVGRGISASVEPATSTERT